MRRLGFTHRLKQWLAVGFACFALVLCGVAFADHAQTETPSSNVACNASCHSHGQPVGGQAGILIKQGDDDKEPTPPYAYWLIGAVALAVLYPKTRYTAVPIRPTQRLYLTQASLRF